MNNCSTRFAMLDARSVIRFFIYTYFYIAKEAETLNRIDRAIRGALGRIRNAYKLGRDQKFGQLFEIERYILEEGH